MRDKLYIKTMLDNALSSVVLQTQENAPIHKCKIDMLQWAYNFGNLKTENEINNKLTNYREELIALQFNGDSNPIPFKMVNARIDTLEDLLR